MKVAKLNKEHAEEEFSKIPDRKTGQWTELCAGVKKTGQPVEVTDITRGQAYALRRKAKEEGLRVKSTDKSTRILVLPPEKKA